MRLYDCCGMERRAWNLRDRWMAARRPTDSGDTVEKARRGLATRAVKLALQTFAKIAVQMVTRMDSTRRTSMLMHSSIRRLVLLGLLLAGAFSAFPAAAQCCPGDGNGAPKTAVGLGQAYPVAVDQSIDPAWHVYQFQRAGMNYIQVNDRNGTVRAAVGRIDDLVWVLPVGTDIERTFVTGDEMPIGRGSVLYRDSAIEVLRFPDASGDRWVFRASTNR